MFHFSYLLVHCCKFDNNNYYYYYYYLCHGPAIVLLCLHQHASLIDFSISLVKISCLTPAINQKLACLLIVTVKPGRTVEWT